jgi:dihydrofolate synthase/folylpolyglutamate synthase
MNYKETLDYLFSQLPMYQRVGKAAYKVDLANTYLLMRLLGNPENKFKSVHVAGTNGKGSASHMLASIMQESGYKVGLYTSPHLKDFRERVKINGEMITEKEVISFVEKYKAQFEAIDLSFFEWTVGLAFDFFSTQNVDIAIIETGLGGRLDSTNVVIPEVSVITNIGLDHTQFLGDTLAKIAAEKAGIIKNKIPIVIGESQDETKLVFINKAKELIAEITFADTIDYDAYQTDLKGIYQQKNLRTCLRTIQVLIEKGWNVSDDSIKRGLLSVVKNTSLLGRWQILGKEPLIICDTGHNEQGVQQVVNQLKKLECNELHIVFGAVNDKSIDKVLDLLPKNAKYYFCQADIPRALDVVELSELAFLKGLIGEKCDSVTEAFNLAREQAKKDDVVFVGGSTFVVAEVI